MIRYYGIYAHKLDEKLKKIETRTWAKAIENSFQKNPEVCPDCLKYMIKDTVYSFRADNAMKMLIKTHSIVGGVEANLHVLCGFESLQDVSLPAMTGCQSLAGH
jgi:hypothetical protein